MKSEYVIKNFEKLASSPLRKQALLIVEEGYKAIDTRGAILRMMNFNVKNNKLKVEKDVYDLKKFNRVICIGFGKASKDAALVLYELLGSRINAGFFIGLEEIDNLGPDFVCKVGTHPLPSQKNWQYTQQMLESLENLSEKDLVICLVSGGGSALLCAPYSQSIEEEQELFQVLTKNGASIQELNVIRKHTSTLKGGQLIKHIYPASCISIIFSDVPGDDISVVASGPTVLDTSTMYDATKIIEKYDLLHKLNRSKINFIETPKELGLFHTTKNYLAVSSKVALVAMREKAEELGFPVEIFSDHFQGNATELGIQIPGWRSKKGCLLGAGESTVLIKGEGKGGRNSELALSALQVMPENSVLVAVASDGMDNTDAAGAIVDNSINIRAKHLNMDSRVYLDKNDSYHFFENTGDLLFTGLTGANVADFFVFLKK